ncbi:MAG: protoheme IX farnesyltransferase [Proteobacteria bacterium]|nr:protoheme IX farnesyltransferase [Pseudomonadota bacterium]
MEASTTEPVSSLVSDYVELTKPRLTVLAVFTTIVAFYLGSQPLDLVLLGHTLLGTIMIASGAAALNHAFEREVDQRMWRTRSRPIAAGRVTARDGALFGGLLATVGTVYLWLAVNPLTGGLALLAVLSYVLVYTPLKTRTPLCTVVGAVPGALPCMMGWTAARGQIGMEGLVLFSVLFVWQLPHFLAIAWMYQEDYARAGLPMLTVVEPDGTSTIRQIIIWTLTLVPISMTPSLLGVTTPAYFFVALVLGIGFVLSGVMLAVRPTRASARRVLLASVIYLPLLQIAMLLGKVR